MSLRDQIAEELGTDDITAIAKAAIKRAKQAEAERDRLDKVVKQVRDPDYDRPEYTERDLAAGQLADHGWMCGDDCLDCAEARDVLESE